MNRGAAMRNEELLAQISELTEEIARLPKGYISQKTIRWMNLSYDKFKNKSYLTYDK